MSEVKFKKGDVLSPLKDRKRSNEVGIANLKKVKVLEVRVRPWYSNKNSYIIYVEVVEGFHGPKRYPSKARLELYADAFELHSDCDLDYALW